MKIHIKKDDKVKILAGDDKGKIGTVMRVYPKTLRALVTGMNLVKRHTKPSAQNPDGSIVTKEAPIHISNLMVVVDGNATRIGRKENGDGKLQRYSKKTGEFIK